MAKFSANLSFMFLEKSFLERYKAAKDAGFKAVESGFPFGVDLQHVVDVKKFSGVKQVLLNIFTGDVTKGEVGFAAIPGKEKEFRESVDVTVKLARELETSKVHVMAGKVVGDVTPEHDFTYENNLRYAVNSFQNENITVLIEPINKYSISNYYLNSYSRALDVIKKINTPNLKLMLDMFHMQQICGNLTNNLRDVIEYVGHVQIAQVPQRNEPDTPGEINYQYILETLQQYGYDDWIGLEYKPKSSTLEGLKWVSNFGYSL